MSAKLIALILLIVVLAACTPPSNPSSAPAPQPVPEAQTVSPTATPCKGSAVGPRNLLVILDCPAQQGGTEQMLPSRVRVDNRVNRAVTVSTDKGNFEVPANGNGEFENSSNSVSWALK